MFDRVWDMYRCLRDSRFWGRSHLSRKTTWFRYHMKLWFPELSEHIYLSVEPDEGTYIMASKKGFSDWHMVSCRLSDSHAKQFSEWLDGMQKKKIDPVSELMAKGLKLSITWVDQSNSFVVTVTNPDEKQSISSWTDDWYEGLWMSLFKVDVVYDGGAWYDLERSTWG